MILKLVYPITSTQLPFLPDLRKKPRLHLFDTGMVNHIVGLMGDLITEKTIDSVYRGRIAEHIIGQEIVGNTISVADSLEFWTREKKESSAEVDYVVLHKGMIIPIEVKAGAVGKFRSLHQFIEAAPHDWAVRFYSDVFKVQEAQTVSDKKYKLINLPHYIAGKVDNILKQVIG